MIRKRAYVIILFLFLLISLSVKSQTNDNQVSSIQLTDSSTIGLITCSPWDGEVYAMFGHSAIRIKDPNIDIDFVFNYGIFDFDSPNFIGRFIKGQTDYIVEAMQYPYFIFEYENRGGEVREQDLNLSLKEKQSIMDALMKNIRPENRQYRYNFFYDNCSTRPRDIIEKSINGKVIYLGTDKFQTYRNLVHQCVITNPWLQFGIDIVIGSKADKVITDRQKDFLPSYLMHAVEKATIIDKTNSSIRPLVLKSYDLINGNHPSPLFGFSKDKSKFFYDNTLQLKPTNIPLIIGWIIFVLVAVLSSLFYTTNKKNLSKILDTIIYIMVGLAGSLVYFLMFHSTHPCTSHNWNLVWLNPLELIIGLLFFVKKLTKYLYYYHFLNFVVLIIFLILWKLIPQQLEMAFIPFVLVIILRSGINILAYQKTKNETIISKKSRKTND